MEPDRRMPAERQPSSLGLRLRRRRKALGLTMQEVAERAHLSTGFISQVERGLATPSLSSLINLAAVLELSVSHFLDEDARGDGSADPPGSTFSIGGGAIRYRRVGQAGPGCRLNSLLMLVPPGYRSEPIEHEGEEMLFVLKGTIVVCVDEKETTVGPGEAVHHASDRRHNIRNPTGEHAEVLWVGTLQLFNGVANETEVERSTARHSGDNALKRKRTEEVTEK